MKTNVIVCIFIGVSLGFLSPQIVSAGKRNSGGGGKSGHPGGGGAKGGHVGGGGGGAGAHMGSHAQHNVGGNNLHTAGTGGHGQHGLNAHQGTGHGLNSHSGAGLQARHTAKLSGTHLAGNRFAARNHLAGHWRSGLRWRNNHALYAGYHRAWHDHWWWRGHYNDITFVGGSYWGGYWYWDGGYWFPAWGYEPAYLGYLYDGPIYAYANLPPDQVVINVQEALQDQGYYAGDVDGQLGEQTRDALAAYQRDHSLEVTAAIDEPTVQALGLPTEEA